MGGLGDGRDGLTEALQATGVAGDKADQSHPLEPVPLDAEHHRLAGVAGEILLRRSGRQEAAELPVEPLQHGVLELGVWGSGLQILLGDRNGEHVTVPVGEFDVLSGERNLQYKNARTRGGRRLSLLNSQEAIR